MRPTPIIHRMRINLRAPFADKDAVKALGARWDAAKKNWYIVDVEDLTPFSRWIPNSGTNTESTAGVTAPQMKTKNAPTKPSARPTTPNLAKEVPHCGCKVLPWEDCRHTETH